MECKVSLGRRIIVTAANKIGIMADITKITAEHGINIEAVAGYVTEDNAARIMMVTDDTRRAVDALKKKGYGPVEEHEVVVVEAENKAGALKLITERLASNGVDIKFLFGTTCEAGCPSRIILNTSDNEKTLVLFRK
ncbi:MAG: ACT domain-containing protein [Candidatus Omnitrophota bacterium]